jgi:hypothetical protein
MLGLSEFVSTLFHLERWISLKLIRDSSQRHDSTRLRLLSLHNIKRYTEEEIFHHRAFIVYYNL